MIHLEREIFSFQNSNIFIKRHKEDKQEKIHYVCVCKKLPEAMKISIWFTKN